jgi:hypothetical protein
VKAGPLDVTLNWRTRLELWDWFEGRQGNSHYGFGHEQLRVAVGQHGPRLDWLVEGEQVGIFGLPTDAVAPPPLGQLGLGASYYAANANRSDVASAFLKQAYVQWRRSSTASLKLGRFEFVDGAEARSSDATVTALVQTRIAHRLISNFGFSAVQRTFDGAQFAWTADPSAVTAFAARPTEGVFQVNGMPELDIEVYYGAYNRTISAGNGAGSFRAFGVGYVDGRSAVLKTDNRSAAARAADHQDIRIGTWGADYVHMFRAQSAGTFDVVGWAAAQTGAWGALTHRAYAMVGEAGWQPVAPRLHPWVSVGYSYGSGDADPNDQRHGTFFQVLTTPRQYARFPFYNMMNNEDAYASVTLHPLAALALRSDVHGLELANAADLWYTGGGAFQAGTFGYQGRPSSGSRSLATVWDVSGDWQLTRFLTATIYYAYAGGKDVITAVYPQNPYGSLAFVETIVHF